MFLPGNYQIMSLHVGLVEIHSRRLLIGQFDRMDCKFPAEKNKNNIKLLIPTPNLT